MADPAFLASSRWLICPWHSGATWLRSDVCYGEGDRSPPREAHWFWTNSTSEALSRRGRGSDAVSLAVLQQVLGSCERTVDVGADPMER